LHRLTRLDIARERSARGAGTCPRRAPAARRRLPAPHAAARRPRLWPLPAFRL